MSGKKNQTPRKELTSSQRGQIIGAFKMGHNPYSIAKTFGFPTATVYKTVKRYQESGSENPVKRQGRPKILSEREKRALNHIAVNNRQAPLVIITNELNTKLENDLSTKTVRRYLKEMGWNSCMACKKPFLNDKSAANRLKWCRNHINWADEWQNIIFTDESRFCLHKSDGRTRVWRRPGEKYHKECVNTTVKFNGGSAMFWGCFSWWGVGPLVLIEGNMNSESYVNILSKHFVPWTNELAAAHPDEPQLTFQQDLAAIHTSEYTTWWMETHGFNILDWSSHSPDLNPIENLWEHLDSEVRKREKVFSKKCDLVEVVQEEWKKIPLEFLRTLISSMPKRVMAIIQAKGWHTKY
jgi:transposase